MNLNIYAHITRQSCISFAWFVFIFKIKRFTLFKNNYRYRFFNRATRCYQGIIYMYRDPIIQLVLQFLWTLQYQSEFLLTGSIILHWNPSRPATLIKRYGRIRPFFLLFRDTRSNPLRIISISHLQLRSLGKSITWIDTVEPIMYSSDLVALSESGCCLDQSPHSAKEVKGRKRCGGQSFCLGFSPVECPKWRRLHPSQYLFDGLQYICYTSVCVSVFVFFALTQMVRLVGIAFNLGAHLEKDLSFPRGPFRSLFVVSSLWPKSVCVCVCKRDICSACLPHDSFTEIN